MDKNTNKNKNADKNAQKGMNRTEFAQEYSIDTGKANKMNKNNYKIFKQDDNSMSCYFHFK